MVVLTFAFNLECPNVDIRNKASIVSFRYLQEEFYWVQVLSQVEDCTLQEIRIESVLQRKPYQSTILFYAHLTIQVPEGTGILYPFLDSNINTLILRPLRSDLEHEGCYGVQIVQKR